MRRDQIEIGAPAVPFEEVRADFDEQDVPRTKLPLAQPRVIDPFPVTCDGNDGGVVPPAKGTVADTAADQRAAGGHQQLDEVALRVLAMKHGVPRERQSRVAS